jgi:hypothetical protein
MFSGGGGNKVKRRFNALKSAHDGGCFISGCVTAAGMVNSEREKWLPYFSDM